MKPIGEEQQEVASALNDRAVVDYLLQHPEFFIRNAARSNISASRIRYAVRFRWWSGT
nr:Uncharacterized protein conserved in bacteria [Klebsiella pneumoniae]